MPNRDKTGPRGLGPLTGRQMGNCKNAKPILRGRGLGPCGLGLGLRRGFGRGFGLNTEIEPLNLTKAQEKKILEAELTELEAEKSEIEKQLKELKS